MVIVDVVLYPHFINSTYKIKITKLNSTKAAITSMYSAMFIGQYPSFRIYMATS